MTDRSENVEQSECGFCDDGIHTFRGRSEKCPYCGGTGKTATIDLMVDFGGQP